MYPHRIRLRGPWQAIPEGGQPRRLTVPCRLADHGLANLSVVLTRKFGYPGRIDDRERVWITVADVAGWARTTLNGQFLGETQDASFEADVTALLQPRNQLDLSICGASVGETAMEVRALAYLKGVTIGRAEGKLRVEGVVAGTCDRELELYLLVDGRHASYRTIEAGQPFSAELEENGRIVRVELVHVSEVWYVVELTVPDCDRR
jgi:hypothetical protein